LSLGSLFSQNVPSRFAPQAQLSPGRRVNLKQFAEEVEAGLPNEGVEMDAALERQAFYDYQGFRYERRFRRDAESSFDFQGRSHRGSGFLAECIDKLCGHLFSPGPSQRWSEATGDDFLQRVYADNLLDSIMLEADKLSTLNACAAIQIDAAAGDFTLKPITYRLWGREEFCVWTDPDNRSVPIACCVKDKYDQQTRYRLWSDTEVWTFLSAKLRPGQTADGRIAVLGPKETHEYGCLPFTFVHYRLPIRDFNVCAIGELLFHVEVAIDNRLSALDESITKYLNPIAVAEGVPADWKPNIEPQRFLRMPLAHPLIGATGGYDPGPFARLYYLAAQIDVAGAWEDLLKYINQALEASDIPQAAVRMEQTGTQSGIALMVEQEPLMRRAENRRPMFRTYLTDLARRTLTAAGNHYGKPELVATAENGMLTCAWPRPRLAINTPDMLELGIGEVAAGLKSHLMLIQDWYGIGREEALELAEQIANDRKDLEAANPDISAVNVPPTPEEIEEEKQMQMGMNGAAE